jgi:hypothetical protein
VEPSHVAYIKGPISKDGFGAGGREGRGQGGSTGEFGGEGQKCTDTERDGWEDKDMGGGGYRPTIVEQELNLV